MDTADVEINMTVEVEYVLDENGMVQHIQPAINDKALVAKVKSEIRRQGVPQVEDIR